MMSRVFLFFILFLLGVMGVTVVSTLASHDNTFHDNTFVVLEHVGNDSELVVGQSVMMSVNHEGLLSDEVWEFRWDRLLGSEWVERQSGESMTVRFDKEGTRTYRVRAVANSNGSVVSEEFSLTWYRPRVYITADNDFPEVGDSVVMSVHVDGENVTALRDEYSIYWQRKLSSGWTTRQDSETMTVKFDSEGRRTYRVVLEHENGAQLVGDPIELEWRTQQPRLLYSFSAGRYPCWAYSQNRTDEWMPSSDMYKVGDKVLIRAPIVDLSATEHPENISLPLLIGGQEREASQLSRCTFSYYWEYEVQEGDVDLDGIEVLSGRAREGDILWTWEYHHFEDVKVGKVRREYVSEEVSCEGNPVMIVVDDVKPLVTANLTLTALVDDCPGASLMWQVIDRDTQLWENYETVDVLEANADGRLESALVVSFNDVANDRYRYVYNYDDGEVTSPEVTIQWGVPRVLTVEEWSAVRPRNVYRAGDVIEVRMVLNRDVEVAGDGPVLELTIGDTVVEAAYVEDSTGRTLRFKYTVPENEEFSNAEWRVSELIHAKRVEDLETGSTLWPAFPEYQSQHAVVGSYLVPTALVLSKTKFTDSHYGLSASCRSSGDFDDGGKPATIRKRWGVIGGWTTGWSDSACPTSVEVRYNRDSYEGFWMEAHAYNSVGDGPTRRIEHRW